MGLSKSTRIKIMLGIDVVFFLVELISGFVVGSLALMADAFHMLNDIISLLVGLWAVAVARKDSTDKYSFGWLRAEILGAFFNAVFLIALCVSIILEALTRFINPPEISNPVLILTVGCLGLVSNLVGFVVLGGHGHSHGDEHGHEHSHDNLAEEGRSSWGQSGQGVNAADENGPAIDVLPDVAIARATAQGSASPEQGRRIAFETQNGSGGEQRCGSRVSMTSQSRGRERRRASSMRHSRLTSIDDISIHPASFRQDIIAASKSGGLSGDYGSSESNSNSEGEDEVTPLSSSAVLDEDTATESSPLLANNKNASASLAKGYNGVRGRSSSHGKPSHDHSSHSRRRRGVSAGVHKNHCHNQPKKPGKKGNHGHSHGDMGMNAMILHVLGDALGNVGVIVTALIIWLTDWPGRYYADPTVSLFITLIILKSALPLTFATSKVLLQATPDHIAPDEVRRDIEALDGVISCHHVHIWQLSDTKIVASMHVRVAFPVFSSEKGGERYMALAREARRCLHAYGIHSATIQPEFCVDGTDAATDLATYGRHEHSASDDPNVVGAQGEAHPHETSFDGSATITQNSVSQRSACLLECVDDCAEEGCCSTAGGSGQGSVAGSLRGREQDHDHDHDHDHEHGLESPSSHRH